MNGSQWSAVSSASCCLMLLFFAGCGTSSHVVKPSKVLSVSTDEILRHIEEGRKKTYSLKGIAKVNIVTGSIDTTVSEVVVVKSPSSIRLETLGFFGSPLAVFASDGDVFSLAFEKKFMTGRLSSKKMVSAPFPLNLLEIDDLVAIFLGSTPIIKFESSEIIYLDKENRYAVNLHSGDGFKKQVIQIDAESMQLLNSEITDEGLGSELSLSFSKYQDVNGISFPKEIDIKASPNPANLHINYQDIELNALIDSSIFLLKYADETEISIFDK